MVEYPYLSEKAMRVGTPPFSVFFFPTIKQQIECRADVRIHMYSLKPGTAAAAKSLQSCPTLCDPIDGSPPGSPVLGILQIRALEWVAISFSNA